MQLGKHHFGAHVTAVCNTKNVELVRSLGADEVVDYLNEDFTKRGRRTTSSSTRWASTRTSGRGARSSRTGSSWRPIGSTTSPSRFSTRFAKKKVVFAYERPQREDILLLKELLEAGKYRAVIDRTYPLEDVVEATKYVETFQKVGNVVLTDLAFCLYKRVS